MFAYFNDHDSLFNIHAMQTVILTSCQDVVEAKIVQDKLALQGVYSFLSNENYTSLYPHMNGAMGSGIQIFINSEDREKALQVLGKKSAKSLACPRCHATDVRLVPPTSVWGKIKHLWIGIIAAIRLHSVGTDYHCPNCGNDFIS